MNNRLRILIANALSAHRLVSDDPEVRLQAAQALQREAQSDQLPLLTQRLAQEKTSGCMMRWASRWRICN